MPAPLTNTHIHTNYSFSVFNNPAEAVAQAVREGIEILGINDHYTIAGHDEFRRACAVHRLAPLFSMEAVALDLEAQAAGHRLNDPANPGRCYLTAKSVTRPLRNGTPAARTLARMRYALTQRNAQLVTNLNAHLAAIHAPVSLSMAEVEALTPAGNTTERHVIQLLAEKILALGTATATHLFTQLCSAPPPDLSNAAALQDFLRATLIKAGKPDYAPELPEAFEPLPQMVSLYLEMGAIPTYPILGNPITEVEQNIHTLLTRLASHKIFAIEVIPNRNTRERLLEIIDAAQAASIPVFTGTEHNTKTPGPLLDKFSSEEPFRTVFFEGALVALGHAAEIAAGHDGYVRPDGSLRFPHRPDGLAFFRQRGYQAFQRYRSGQHPLT
ncbi:MAG: PHP domain-containing protein [bacterium]|nr:PHP domain-containing protein [bacterium]